ncbi:MAG: HAMP domain-containing sensor histidine kinase [Myxococcaceae bacterium]
MNRPARLALFVAALSLFGSVLASVLIHRQAAQQLEALLAERLRAAGELSARLVTVSAADQRVLDEVMQANHLEGATLAGEGDLVIADARGAPGRPLDKLRIDTQRLKAAWAGEISTGKSYEVEQVGVWTGYFPVSRDGAVKAVLLLEAGEAFEQPLRTLRWALMVALLLSALGSAALAALTVWWTKGERERLQMEAKAARAALIARLAAAAAHEIRNPLGIIRGNADLMRERMGAKLDEKDVRALADIQGEVERLKHLTDDLMSLDEQRKLDPLALDLTPLLDGAAEAAEAAFPGTKVVRRFEKVPEVEVDPARLRQVLVNLLSNAAQVKPGGEVQLTLAARGSEVVIEVTDQGPGVADSVRSQLFEPFTTGRSGGTGLGLYVSRQLVERHGGSLTLRNGQPTTFVLALPSKR